MLMNLRFLLTEDRASQINSKIRDSLSLCDLRGEGHSKAISTAFAVDIDRLYGIVHLQDLGSSGIHERPVFFVTIL